MSTFTPQSPDYVERVQESFSRQEALSSLGAELAHVGPGTVEIQFPFDQRWTQQHGFLHAGIVSTVLDSACGYAAFSLMPAEAAVLSVEFKINLLAPARGETFRARGSVIRPGRTITVCGGEAEATAGGKTTTIATMQATIMAIFDRPEVQG